MITGYITLEDTNGLEIEVETTCGPKLITVQKKDYPNLKQGDIIQVFLEKISS